MRNYIHFTAMAALSIGAPAMAQDATGTVGIDGQVADRCLFKTDSATISVGELVLGGSGTTAGKLDPARLDGQTRTLVGWCNGTAATIQVEALPLLNTSFTGTAPSGFDSRVDITASAGGARLIAATDTSITAGLGTAANIGLFTGSVDVSLSNSSTPTNGLLVAGTYVGEVVVTLAPNVSFGGG